MNIDQWKTLLEPETTYVHVDLTRGEEGGNKELGSRLSNVAGQLARLPVPEEDLQVLEDTLNTPSGFPGPHGLYVAVREGALVFRQVTAPPITALVGRGPAPLTPLIGRVRENVRLLLVTVDRSGADIEWSGSGQPEMETQELYPVEGEHDELRKVSAGGWSQRRYQARAEDSWERNAEHTAAHISKLTKQLDPDLILLTGDVRSIPLVKAALSHEAYTLIKEVSGGSRAPGVNREAFERSVNTALEEYRSWRDEEALAALDERLGKGAGAVSGARETMNALRMGQVESLFIFLDDAGTPIVPEYDAVLGMQPAELAFPQERDTLNASEVFEVSFLDAVLAQAVLTDASLNVSHSAPPLDGIAATLRWS